MQTGNRTKINSNVFLYTIPLFLMIILFPVMGHFQTDKYLYELIGKRLTMVVFWSIFILCMLLPFIAWYISSGKRRAYIEEIQKNGQEAIATIKTIKLSGTKITSGVDEKWSVDFELEVKTKTGETYIAHADFFVAVLQIPQYQPGNLVQVKYDPANKTDIVIIGLS